MELGSGVAVGTAAGVGLETGESGLGAGAQADAAMSRKESKRTTWILQMFTEEPEGGKAKFVPYYTISGETIVIFVICALGAFLLYWTYISRNLWRRYDRSPQEDNSPVPIRQG